MENLSSNPAISPQKSSILADLNVRHIALIIIVGIFATTMAQPQVLAKIPLQFILKDELHRKKDDVAGFFFLCGLAWYFKPLAGILSDGFPLMRTRRRHYVLFGSVLAGLSWVAMLFVPHEYTLLLWMTIIINVFLVIASTALGGFLVEAGQTLGNTGKLTSVRLFVQNACSLIQGPLGGALAKVSFAVTSLACSASILSIFPVVYFFLKEKREAVTNKDAFANAGMQLKTIGKSRNLWTAAAFLCLFYFAPGTATTLFYRQSETLHFTPEQIGLLGLVSGLGGIIAAVTYSQLCKKFDLKHLIISGVIVFSALNFLYLLYTNLPMAFVIDFQNGFFFTLCELALLDLAARSTPNGCEGLGYSLILSVRNLALFGADWLGSHFAEQYHWQFSTLVTINSLTTLSVLLLLPILPKAVIAVRDRA